MWTDEDYEQWDSTNKLVKRALVQGAITNFTERMHKMVCGLAFAGSTFFFECPQADKWWNMKIVNKGLLFLLTWVNTPCTVQPPLECEWIPTKIFSSGLSFPRECYSLFLDIFLSCLRYMNKRAIAFTVSQMEFRLKERICSLLIMIIIITIIILEWV